MVTQKQTDRPKFDLWLFGFRFHKDWTTEISTYEFSIILAHRKVNTPELNVNLYYTCSQYLRNLKLLQVIAVVTLDFKYISSLPYVLLKKYSEIDTSCNSSSNFL